jgi:hypothetical protein
MSTAPDPPCALVSELAGGREVEQEGVTVNIELAGVDRFPLKSGKSSNTVPILYLK